MKHVTSSPPYRTLQGILDESRLPDPQGKFPVIDRFVSQETETNTPITEMVVNSLITARRWQESPAGRRFRWPVSLGRGYGIATVEVSEDEERSGKRRNSRGSRALFMAPMVAPFCAGTAGRYTVFDEGDQSRWRHADIRADIHPAVT